MKLQDDPATSPYLKPPAAGIRRRRPGLERPPITCGCANMLVNGGELDGARIRFAHDRQADGLQPSAWRQGPRPEMSRSLFSEATNEGVGFGLGVRRGVRPAEDADPLFDGREFYWGGAASTAFWVDPVEQVTAVFMTQLLPSSTYPIRRELRTLVYSGADGDERLSAKLSSSVIASLSSIIG